jgi:thiamine biosynthesis protein ThiS
MMGTAVAAGNVALTVNGGRREIPDGWTLADLLASLDLDPRMVVVERNATIVRDRDSFARIPLSAGDTLEIVHFVGGG